MLQLSQRGRGAFACLLLVLCCAGGVSTATVKFLNGFAGPYLAYGHFFVQCESERTIVFNIRGSHFNPAKPDEKQTITGNTTTTVDINDRLWGRVRMDRWSNNQWKENAFLFKFPQGACSAIREHIPDFFQVMFKPGARVKRSQEPCNIPRGVYVVNREPVAWVFPKFPIMPYGRYRFNVMLGSGNVTQGCLAVDCSIIPKLT